MSFYKMLIFSVALAFVPLIFSCFDYFEQNLHQPLSRYLVGDRILAGYENEFETNENLLNFCQENDCDFSNIQDIAVLSFDDIFILNDFGEILKISDGHPQFMIQSRPF